ncbi:MAG: DUF3782 domain-containing protein [Desulfurococcales archaeon]|nr:DUF3782 domain-containing protein [Desulfurococcales archaeon]
MPALSHEEKERLLKAIEEDRGFRYALMGLLGFKELLERFSKLEERQHSLEERMARLEERHLKLEERYEALAKLVIQQGELLKTLAKEVREVKAGLGALGRRLGRGFEAMVREAFRDLLKGLGIEEYEVKKFRYVDVDGKYVAPGAVIEVDLVLRDSILWLIEVKSLVEEDDVTWFRSKTRVIESILGRRADRRLILGVTVAKGALEYARKLGVEVVYVSLVD